MGRLSIARTSVLIFWTRSGPLKKRGKMRRIAMRLFEQAKRLFGQARRVSRLYVFRCSQLLTRSGR